MRARWLVGILGMAIVLPVPAAMAADGDVNPPYGKKIVYKRGERVPAVKLMSIGIPEDIGGSTIEGPMALSAHTEYFSSATRSWGGVLQATKGTARYHMDQDRHETVLIGSLEITDQFGNQYDLKAGDTYLARQGSTITWRAKTSTVQTTFLTYPAVEVDEPITVYRVGAQVPDNELAFLGDPEAFGVITLSGDTHPMWRFDTSGAGQLGGVISGNRSVLRFDPPYLFTIEHGTMTVNSTLFTDLLGDVHLLEPGDSYFAHRDFGGIWDQSDRIFQKTFLTGTDAP